MQRIAIAARPSVPSVRRPESSEGKINFAPQRNVRQRLATLSSDYEIITSGHTTLGQNRCHINFNAARQMAF
ncbi:hypothetical protein DFQ30_004416, partial [Apophysomyces sp. BC1015]